MQNHQDQPNDQSRISTLDKIKWSELIVEWENSNESQKQFCDRLGINVNSFTYMRGKLLSSGKKIAKSKKFIPVTIAKEEDKENNKSTDTIILENSNGVKLHISLSIPFDKLSHLLQLVGWSHA